MPELINIENNKKQKVLIVDDSPENITLLNKTLRNDYSTFFAMNGEEALRVAADISPDMILLDIMMPGMDGYETCRKLKADSELNDIPVIFLTAMSLEEHQASGLELGAVDYITKPFNPSLVKLRIKNQLEIKKQRDMLTQLSTSDALTGISNRRMFQDFIVREWKRAIRMRSEISLLMMDLDFFKQYNDTLGHIAGDECLRKVAKCMVHIAERPADLIARYGGEEFAGILPDTGLQGAYHIAEKISQSIYELDIKHPSSQISDRISISIGLGNISPGPDDEYQEFIHKTDLLLYEAKHKGRNCIVSNRFETDTISNPDNKHA